MIHQTILQKQTCTIDLKLRYQREERTKLADEIENDVIYLARFIGLLTQQSTDEIEEEIAKINPWHKEYLRHLDKALEAWDYLQSTFERVMEEYNKEFPNSMLTKKQS